MKGNLDELVKEQQVLEKEIKELEKQKAINNNQIDNLRHDLKRNDARYCGASPGNGRRFPATRCRIMKPLKNSNFKDAVTLLEEAEEKRQQDMQKRRKEQKELSRKIARTKAAVWTPSATNSNSPKVWWNTLKVSRKRFNI